MRLYFRIPLLVFRIATNRSLPRPFISRCSGFGLLGLLVFFLLASGAGAQNVPEVSPGQCVDYPGHPCSGSSRSSGESDEERRERAEARAEEKAERDAQKRADKQAKEEAKEHARQQAEAERQAALEAERQREMEAARQRQLAIEAQRLQAAFNEMKPAAVNDLKGVDGATAGTGVNGGGLELKGLDDAPRTASQPAWDANITDPEVAIYARRLDSVVPPLPIPAKEVALNWKQIYLNDDRLMDTTDVVVAGWEMTGVLGESISIPIKILMIGGKSFIAGENAAYMYLVKKDADYDAALAYLKNPAQAQKFARLVQDVQQSRPVPATTDPAMVNAARAITDPKLGDTGKMVWDAMTSKDALVAMVRKATIEVGTEMLSPSTEGLLPDEAERKAMFDSVRLERNEARKLLTLSAKSDVERAQLKTVIEHADQLSADMYRLEKVGKVASALDDELISEDFGAASEAVAKHFLGDEAEGREY